MNWSVRSILEVAKKIKDLLLFRLPAAIGARLDAICGFNLLVLYSTLSGFPTGNLV